MKLTLENNGKITVNSVPGAKYEVEPDGESTYNQSRLLQNRKIFLSYKFKKDDNVWHVTDTLTFRNRIRDGVNEWQDENASKSIPDVFPDSPDDNNVEVIAPYKIQTRKNSTSSTWTTYDAYTLDCLKGFIKGEAEPVTDKYGGWKVGNNAATGFFRVEKIGSRWWLITPEGNLYISKGVTAFSPGNSVRSKSELQKKFGTVAEWAKKEIVNLKDMGFNSVGAWSRDSEILRLKDEEKIPYTVIVSPMGALNGAMKSRGEEKEGRQFQMRLILTRKLLLLIVWKHIFKRLHPLLKSMTLIIYI